MKNTRRTLHSRTEKEKTKDGDYRNLRVKLHTPYAHTTYVHTSSHALTNLNRIIIISNYLEEFERLKESLKDCEIRKPGSIWLEGWNDELLENFKEHSPHSFSSKTYDRKNLKYILIRFFHLYLQGSVTKGDNVFSIISDMIALSETEDGKIWAAPPPGTSGFYMENESKPEILEITLQSNYSHNHMLFYNYINKVIQCIDPVGTATKTETQVVRFASFLALTLLQAGIKYKNQVSKYFHSHEYKSHLMCVALWPPKNPYCAPCDKCFEICEQCLHTSKPYISKMFVILVSEYISASKPSYPNSSTTKFLEKAVLDKTAGNGMAMITLLEQVCEITSLSWKEVKEMTLYDTTLKSWERITDFATVQWCNSKPQYSYKWARIINNDYFKEVSPRENMFLTVLVAAVVETVNVDIWNSSWAKNINPYAMRAKKYGYALYKQCSENKLT